MSQEEPALQQNPKKYLQLCMCVRGLHELLLRVCGSFGCRMSIFCLGITVVTHRLGRKNHRLGHHFS